jgi:SNF2 family DNA or RNA helicase
MGQKYETTVSRLICSGTVDDAVVATLESKADTQEGFMEMTSRNLRVLTELI